MEKFVNNKFSNSYIATMGVDYRKKTLKLESTIIHMQVILLLPLRDLVN